MAKTTKKDTKIADVAKPGESAPDASSRPVIVGHRTIMQDPMVTPASADEDKKEQPTVVSTTAPTLKPLNGTDIKPPDSSEPTKIAVKTDKADDKKPVEKSEDESPAYVIESIKSPVDEDEKPEESKKEAPQLEAPAEAAAPSNEEKAYSNTASQADTGSDEAAATATADQAAEKTTQKEDKEIAERQEATQKLITDKTYYLPIGEAKRKRNMSLVLLLVLLLVAAAIAYLAVDAGVIKTSIKLPVEFFK